MNLKKAKLCALFLIGIGLTSLQAQSMMYVKDKDGTQTAYTLSSIRTLTFLSGNMQVNKNDGTSGTYSLSNINNLSFKEPTGVSQISAQQAVDMHLFPNPVIDELKISYKSSKTEIAQIEIFDLQGKVLYRQTKTSLSGTNLATFNVAQLPLGTYICRLQNGNNSVSVKFMKK
jgi:hypothetical protein